MNFLVLLVVMGGVGVALVQGDLNQRVAVETQGFDRFGQELTTTIGALGVHQTDAPCSEPFLNWLRRVAYLPDGIHEIIYAPNGLMRCAVSFDRIDPPVQLAEPDFAISRDGSSKVWLDRDLSMLGLPGAVGTFLQIGDFVLVLPVDALTAPMPESIDYEIVYRALDGRIWHRLGSHDLYGMITGAIDVSSWSIPKPTGFVSSGCSTTATTCIALSSAVGPLVAKYAVVIGGMLLLAAAAAGIGTHLLRGALERVWSLPSRFRRLLSAKTVVCHYQPLLDLREDRISAVEVLARWRDDDDTLVYPDAFLPIVESRGLQRRFTRYLVDRAYRDLSGLIAGPRPLLVHFNIFPSDFDPDWMIELFRDFLADKSRFTVVIELVESDVLPIDSTRAAIARLKKAGILTFIDDFGEGYSSIGYLAGLGTHGVKLDRSFGMAPEGSLMDAMMDSAIEMVAKTGQVLVVEGVETIWRLTSLKANSKVAQAQGYYISRPVDVVALGALLGDTRFWPKSQAA